MGRRRYERHGDTQERWPLLFQVIAGHFYQDYDYSFGTVNGAFAAALDDCTFDQKQQFLKEWRDWNVTEGAVDDIRPSVNDGFLVGVLFKEPIDARNFMNQLHDVFIASVRAETRPHK